MDGERERMRIYTLTTAIMTYRGFNVAAIGILSLPIEHLLIQIDVVIINGIVEGDGNHHGNIL